MAKNTNFLSGWRKQSTFTGTQEVNFVFRKTNPRSIDYIKKIAQ